MNPLEINIRTRQHWDDEDFLDTMNYESFKVEFYHNKQASEEEMKEAYRSFDEGDPIDPWGPDHMVCFAECDKRLAGVVWMAVREPFWEFKEKHVWIYNIHVTSQNRRKGIARRLLAKTEEWTLQRGLNKIGLHVVDHNTPALRLYESMGYNMVAQNEHSCYYQKTLGDER